MNSFSAVGGIGCQLGDRDCFAGIGIISESRTAGFVLPQGYQRLLNSFHSFAFKLQLVT